MSSDRLPRLMLVTDRRRTRGRDLVRVVREAVRGGVRLVQLRERDLPDDELRELVGRLRTELDPTVRLVVNGSPRVARLQHTGLHLAAAAAAAGPIDLRGEPFGRSVHDDGELARALGEGVDYVVAGTVFRSAGKPERAPGGVALLERICRQAHPVPVFAIGGVDVARIPSLLHAGAYGVAVCGAILSDNDPRRVAEAMQLALAVVTGEGTRP